MKLSGDSLAILSGFDVDRLCRSSETGIISYVDVLIDKVGVCGGYALGLGNSMAHGVSIKSYLIVLDEGWRKR